MRNLSCFHGLVPPGTLHVKSGPIFKVKKFAWVNNWENIITYREESEQNKALENNCSSCFDSWCVLWVQTQVKSSNF